MMRIFEVKAEKLEKAYGILCQSLCRVGALPDETPFGITYCVIEPKGETAPHKHYDGEYFFVLKGQGEMQINKERAPVVPGHLIQISNHSVHKLLNSSEKEELHFLSIYWDKPALGSLPLGENHLIIPAPPTPNGKLHLGHLSGPYLAADVLGRYLRSRKTKAVVVCGADENQTYVPFKAWQENRRPLEVMEDYSSQIQNILKLFNASPNHFLEPHRAGESYTKFVQDFYRILLKKGAFYRKKVQAPFSPERNCFVHEAYISGLCPHCQKPTNGNGCEGCGFYNDALDLIDPICNITRNPVKFREIEKYYFDLRPYQTKLLSAFSKSSFSPDIKAFGEGLIQNGLTEISVTFPGTWGIPAPDLEGQIIYEWIEMAAAYLWHARQQSPAQNHEDFWKGDGKVILSFGFDNSYYYLALVPALLWAFDEKIKYPDGFLINQFYLLDGKKFSTSRKHAIWGDEILSAALTEPLRLYLAATRAEGRETNFSLEQLGDFVDDRLSKWDELLNHVEEAFSTNQTTLSGDLILGPRERAYLRELELAQQLAETYYHWQAFSLNQIAEIAHGVIEKTLRFLASSKPSLRFSTCDAERKTLLLLSATGIKVLAQIVDPLMPETARSLRESLGMNIAASWERFLEPLHEVSLKKFPRIGKEAKKGLASFQEKKKA